jgi:predicted nucleic acid-binding protein
MDILIDTNILVGSVQIESALHSEAIHALLVLRDRGDRVCVVPQNVYEFWAVATRPIENNGLGMTPRQAHDLAGRIESLYKLLRDPPDLYDEWRRLVVNYGVSGKKTHDARLVAAMAVHGMTQIVTYNTADFARFGGISAIHPASFK